MSNSFGFGGHNASLLIGRYTAFDEELRLISPGLDIAVACSVESTFAFWFESATQRCVQSGFRGVIGGLLPECSNRPFRPSHEISAARQPRMSLPDWGKTALEDGVLRETTADSGRVVLWLPGERDGTFQYWERVGSVARAEVSVEQGLYSTAAASIPAKQRHKGVLGKLLGRFHEAKGNHTLVLPGGETVEPCGERSTDLLLVWSQDNGQPLDESRIKSVWPEARRHRRLGPNIFLVGGLLAENGQTVRPPTQPVSLSDGNPRTLAEALLSGARQGGDRVKELSALTDLAIITLNEGKTRVAISQFRRGAEAGPRARRPRPGE